LQKSWTENSTAEIKKIFKNPAKLLPGKILNLLLAVAIFLFSPILSLVGAAAFRVFTFVFSAILPVVEIDAKKEILI